MFGRGWGRDAFEREVQVEIEYLTKVHGEDAARVAAEKAARSSNRTQRQKILDETLRRLRNDPVPVRRNLLDMIFRK